MAVADVRRGDWGSPFPPELVRDFIHSALRHPTAADMVSEYFLGIAIAGEDAPDDMAEAVQVAIGEVLSAATREDWKQVAREQLANAHETIGDDPPEAVPVEPVPTAWWPPLPGRAPP